MTLQLLPSGFDYTVYEQIFFFFFMSVYCLFENEYHFELFLPLFGDILSSDGEHKLAKIVGLSTLS